MSVRDVVGPVAERAGDLVAGEVAYWRRELQRPWREGGDEPAARVGRWIGLGLAVGAVVAGVVAALRVERPWE